MTSGVVTLVAQQRNCATEIVGKLFKEIELRVEIASEILKEPRVVTVIAQLVAHGLRRAQTRFMTISNADAGQAFAQRCLSEAATPRDRQLADI